MSKPKWGWAVFGMLSLWVFLGGFVSGDVVSMVVAIVMAFLYPSLFLTSYVKSDHIVKRALEVIFMLSAFSVVIYGYAITGSLILGVITIFIVTMVFIAFILSYLLPKIRSKSRNYDTDVKDEGKEKDDFAYDVGRELGREMREGLEEKWKSHVIAGVIAMGSGLPVILLKLPWYIVIIVVFISYQIADYVLSKSFKKLRVNK